MTETTFDGRAIAVSRHGEAAAGQGEAVAVVASRPSMGIADIVYALRRNWRLPALGLVTGLLVGLILVSVIQTPYKSSARVLIDRSLNRYLQSSKIIDQPTLDDTEIGSQVYLLSSDSVILPVVRALKLTEDRELAGKGGATPAEAERAAVESVLKRLTVYREDVANVISVTFESQNAAKAAEIANAIAESYIQAAAEQKLKSTKIVSTWLEERLSELKPKVSEAEQALLAYREANHLPTTGLAGLQSADRVANLKLQLENARIATVEAKQRYERVKASPEDVTSMMSADGRVNQSRQGMISFAMNNTDLVRLRAQARDLAVRAADIESRVGPEHAAAKKIRQQYEAAQSAMRAEEERLVDAYANEYKVAATRENELTATLAEVSGEGDASGQLRELEGAVTTLRNLQAGFQKKFKEINSAQSETLPVQNAHIITAALPQLQKSIKKPLALFGGALGFFFLLGTGAAVGREWLADVFRTSASVEHLTGIDCVVLPALVNSVCAEEHVLAAPYSRFAESLRHIRAAMDLVSSPERARVIGVVSATPKEGKTVVAANLGALTAVSSSSRTLLIDTDMHMRRLTDALARDAKEGLIEALEDPSRLSALVVRRPRSGLDVLPCVVQQRLPNAAELLGSQKMERLIAAARQNYDYIILEVAPIMSVVDVKMVERFIDGFAYVVEWGQTRRALVIDALTEAHMIRDRIIAVVLNKVDAEGMKMIDAKKGSKSADYYQE